MPINKIVTTTRGKATIAVALSRQQLAVERVTLRSFRCCLSSSHWDVAVPTSHKNAIGAKTPATKSHHSSALRDLYVPSHSLDMSANQPRAEATKARLL